MLIHPKLERMFLHLTDRYFVCLGIHLSSAAVDYCLLIGTCYAWYTKV